MEANSEFVLMNFRCVRLATSPATTSKQASAFMYICMCVCLSARVCNVCACICDFMDLFLCAPELVGATDAAIV